MLQMFVITLREGIEAFLIVAIALAYLRKTGRDALVPAVFWGTGAGVALSLILGIKLAEAKVLPLDNEYWHEATEAYAEGIYAQIYSLALVLIPAAWLAVAAIKSRTTRLEPAPHAK